MAAGTVRVRGLRETQAAFRSIDRKLPKVIQTELKQAAEPVAVEARAKVGRYQGAKPQQIRPRASLRSVFVTQHARKRTGLRPDFGTLQMRILVEALFDKQGEVLEGVEDALDRLGRSEGF